MKTFRLPGTSLLTLISLLAPAALSAQSTQLTATLDRIFNKHEFASAPFGPARWLHEGAEYTTVEPSAEIKGGQDSARGQDIVQYDTASGKRTVLVAATKLLPSPGAKPLHIEDYTWSPDDRLLLIFTNSKKVWRLNTRGDYWVLDLASGKLTKLGGDAPESTLMFAKFSPDSRRVAFVRANNIYVQDLSTYAVHALTTDGSNTLINGTSDWVNEEELKIRDGFRWSPDSQSIAFWQFDTSGVGDYTLINDTAQEYPETTRYLYPQPGTTNSAVRAGVVSAQGGPVTWVKLPGDPRQHYIARLDWVPDSNDVILQYLNRLQNTNTVYIADAKTGEAKPFFEDTDKAWVDVVDTFDWVDNNKSLVWLSERDGWRHAYVVSRATGKPQLITNFAADVMREVAVDDAHGWFYFEASPDNATQAFLYRSRLDGTGTPERVTPSDLAGTHFYDLSPNGEWAFHIHSNFTTPPVTELVHLPDHKVVRTLQTNEQLAAKVKDLLSLPVEFFKVPVSNGVTLDGFMIRPPNFDPAKKYPVLVNVYGEPAATLVRDAWGGNGRLFHALIAREGYIVVSFDNQGTPAPKGREWRKVVYGAVGVLSAAQQADAIRALAKEHSYIDTSRMAIWGWSGGGSNTLNLMFRSPGLFSTGIAVAPVADEAHYDTIYQERYMGLPQDNAKGYHDGSPINFAQNLTGHLLVVHGSGDDNVHFQGTELLINKLVELGKPFDFMDYPNRTHCICEGSGTSFHIYSLIARYLEEHVPPGGLPK